jgi:hypothetical protein
MGDQKTDLSRARQLVRDWRQKPLAPDTAEETLALLIADLLQRERETCARLAEEVARRNGGEVRVACENVAACIRTRSKPAGLRAPGASVADRLLRTYLRINPETYYCVRCLAAELKLGARDTHQAAEHLVTQPGFECGFFWCSRCAESRHVLRFSGLSAPTI